MEYFLSQGHTQLATETGPRLFPSFSRLFSLKTCCLRHQDEDAWVLIQLNLFFVFPLHTDDAVQSTDTQDTAEVTAFNSGEAMDWSHEGHCLQLKADLGSNDNSATDIYVRLVKLCNLTGTQFPCL